MSSSSSQYSSACSRCGAAGTGELAKPSRNIAATTPNRAMNADNSSDCDIAAANGSCRKPGSWVTDPSPLGPSAASGISALIRVVMNAAMLALPSTDPTCLVALYTPEPAPATVGPRLRVAVAASGDQMNAMPTPVAVSGNTIRQIGVVAVISTDNQVSATANSEKPKPMIGRGWWRSTILPTHGASTPVAIAIGAVRSAERVGERPHSAWA